VRDYGHVTVPITTWQRVAAEIAARIRSGKNPVGSKIPGYRQWADQFDTSLGSVRRAVEYLTGIGVVRGHPGSGVYVLRVPTEKEIDFAAVTTEEIADRVAVLERNLAELYQRLGQPYPSG
jgi:DNA-binding GntR family transcriptional regulator